MFREENARCDTRCGVEPGVPGALGEGEKILPTHPFAVDTSSTLKVGQVIARASGTPVSLNGHHTYRPRQMKRPWECCERVPVSLVSEPLSQPSFEADEPGR